LKLRDIAERLHCRLEGAAGSGDTDIHRVAGIEHAGPGDLTFVANPRYRALVGQTRASAVILATSCAQTIPTSPSRTRSHCSRRRRRPSQASIG
jgi:UDP-3-O-[3-hydroxymyristoyl] glucosamine N-acyltransferase